MKTIYKKQFTDEQNDDLQFYLKEFDVDQVKNFIQAADWLLDMSWHVVGKQSYIEDFHYQMDKIIDQVTKMEAKTREYLRSYNKYNQRYANCVSTEF